MENWDGIVRLFGNTEELLTDFDSGHYITGHDHTLLLESKLSQLLSGWPVIATTRGSTAIQTVIYNFCNTDGGRTANFFRVKSGIACAHDVYPGTKLFLQELVKLGLIQHVVHFDPANTEELQTILDAKLGFDLVFTETIGNSLGMGVADIPKLKKFCQTHGKMLIIDTTFTPGFVPSPNPEPGIIIVSSLTKHGQPDDDQTGGYIAAHPKHLDQIKASRFFNHEAMLPAIAHFFRATVENGFKISYPVHCRHALALAQACQASPAVLKTSYPGLPDHPNYDLVVRDYQNMAGGVFYIILHGEREAATKFTDELISGDGDWQLGVSFGSSHYRVFPFITEKMEMFVKHIGVVRLSPGRIHPEKNLAKLQEALSSLS